MIRNKKRKIIAILADDIKKCIIHYKAIFIKNFITPKTYSENNKESYITVLI